MADAIRDGSLADLIPDIPAFAAPTADVFAARAERFDALAAGYSLEGYLRFALALSRAQDAALAARVDVAIPDEDLLGH